MSESDPSCRQFRILADMVKVRLDQLPQRKAGIAAYWYQTARRAGRSEKPPALAVDATTQARQLVSRLGELLDEQPAPAMLRYETFTAFFALLGCKMDDDAIEIIQTGLGALDWESLTLEQRKHFAVHLRHLAGQIAPETRPPTKPGVASEPRVEPRMEPHYDQVIFGDQTRLLQALREQPSDVSLDRFLRSLADKSDRQN